jgi:hypothetical protein
LNYMVGLPARGRACDLWVHLGRAGKQVSIECRKPHHVSTSLCSSCFSKQVTVGNFYILVYTKSIRKVLISSLWINSGLRPLFIRELILSQ